MNFNSVSPGLGCKSRCREVATNAVEKDPILLRAARGEGKN